MFGNTLCKIVLVEHRQDLKSIQFNTAYLNECSFISNYRLLFFCIHISLCYTTVYCFVYYSYCKPSLQMMSYNIIDLHFCRLKFDFYRRTKPKNNKITFHVNSKFFTFFGMKSMHKFNLWRSFC